MAKPAPRDRANTHDFREPWLRDAVARLRPHFARHNLTIPEKLRCAFGMTTAGAKGARKGECWPATGSADGHCEIFISPDIAAPREVLRILVAQLLHACMPENAGHGPRYRDAALRIGLVGRMRQPELGPDLADRLDKLAETLGPLPHASLDLTSPILNRPSRPVGAPKKQRARMLKAECLQHEGGKPCGYTLRIAAQWVKDVGAPHCPKHGPMTVAAGAGDDREDDAAGSV